MSVTGALSDAPRGIEHRCRRCRRAVLRRAGQRAIRGGDSPSYRRGMDRRLVRARGTASRLTPLPVATLDGDVFRGPHLVSGGGRAEARGILETKREIKELARAHRRRPRGAGAAGARRRPSSRARIAQASSAIAALARRAPPAGKGDRRLRGAAPARGRRGRAAGAEGGAARARAAPGRRGARRPRRPSGGGARVDRATRQTQQRDADERLTVAQRRLFEAREAAEELSRRAAEAGAAHAALVERASALATEVAAARGGRRRTRRTRVRALAPNWTRRGAAWRNCGRRLPPASAARRRHPRARRPAGGRHQAPTRLWQPCAAAPTIWRRRSRRHALALEAIRAVGRSSTSPARPPKAELSHLAHTCEDAVQATLDEVVVEVEELERDGHADPDADVIFADEPDEDREDDSRQSSVGSLESSVSSPTDDLRQRLRHRRGEPFPPKRRSRHCAARSIAWARST